MPITTSYQMGTATEKIDYALEFNKLAPDFYTKLLQNPENKLINWETYYRILTEGPTVVESLPSLLVKAAQEIFENKEIKRLQTTSVVRVGWEYQETPPPASFLEVEKEDFEYTLAACLLGKANELNKPLRMQDHPLHWDLFVGKSLKYISLLVAFGSNVNALGRRNNTPLHYAVKNMTGTLARSGDNNKLKEAIISNHTAIIKLLLTHGADPTKKNSDNLTPADLAKPYEEIIQLFNQVKVTSTPADPGERRKCSF